MQNLLQQISTSGPIADKSADLSPSVSAGLTAAGVDPTTAQVLGQVANLIAMPAVEKAAPGIVDAATRAPGAALSGGLSLMDLLSAPELAYAKTQPAAGAAAGAAADVFGTAGRPATTGASVLQSALDRLSQYPEEIATPVRNALTSTEAPASDVAGLLHQWMNQNPVSDYAQAAAAAAPKALESLAPEERAAVEHVVSELGGGTEARPAASGGGGGGGTSRGTSTVEGGAPPPTEAKPTAPTAGPRAVEDIQADIARAQRQFAYQSSTASGDASRGGRMAGPEARQKAAQAARETMGRLNDLQDELTAARKGEPYTPTATTTTTATPTATPTTAAPTPGGGGGGGTPRGTGTPTGGGGGGTPPPTGTPPPPTGAPTPPTETPVPTPATGTSGNIFSRLGQKIASTASPTQNLSAQGLSAAQTAIENYANMVGRHADAASVIANSESLRVGPGGGAHGLTPTGINLIRDSLTQKATDQLVRDLQGQGLAAPTHSAPSNYRLVTNNPKNPLVNYAFDPRVVGPVKNVTEASAIAHNPLGHAILNATGTAKSTLFSLSNFHTMTEGLNALFTSPETFTNFGRAFFSDSFAKGLRGSMATSFDDAAKAGVTGLGAMTSPDAAGGVGNALWKRVTQGAVGGVGGAASGYTEAKIAGKSDDEARLQALYGGLAGVTLGAAPTGRGTVPDILNSALWQRAVPMAKATAWEGLTRGGMTPDLAAQVVNERFGGLNYAAMGRNPALMDASKLLIQAPDWTESTVRQLGSAMPFIGGAGQGQRSAFLAKAIGGMLATTEVANYALSGHSTLDNQPGHQFEIEVPDPAGGYMHIGLLPGNIQSYLNLTAKLGDDTSAKRSNDIANFVIGRGSELTRLPVEAVQTATASSPLQQPYAVSKAGLAGLLSTLAPIGISQVQQGTEEGDMNPGIATLMAVLGLNPRYTSAATAARSGVGQAHRAGRHPHSDRLDLLQHLDPPSRQGRLDRCQEPEWSRAARCGPQFGPQTSHLASD